ncbi:MAG TPA: 3-oxoacyl-ACP reductase FabG [Acidimicrobiales bacterium]|nr:3-oxoacyl-ACP reductase FabG [Acidimicrobiales bacterium]
MTGSRVVLVTGGARGIGLACARAFVAAGDRVAVTYRTKPPEDDDVLAVACDVTSTAEVDAAVDEVEEQLGKVEVVVANAGANRDGLVLKMSDDAFDEVLDTNLAGAFRVARRAARSMVRARTGRLIFISSVVGLTGSAGQVNYAASKAGLVGLARSLARELAPRGITANVVAPGPVATDMTDALPEARRAELAAAVPLGRFATTDEVAAAVTFLASPEAAAITGAVLPVDGGLGMGH